MNSGKLGLGKSFLEKSVGQFVRRNNLSERERDVFGLLVRGITSSEKIAAELGVSRNTIRNHFQNIFYKTRASSKTELLSLLIGEIFGEAVDEGARPHSLAIHILYVEDDSAFAELAVRALQKANLGGSIVVVPDGDSAIAYLRQKAPFANGKWKRPQVILLDMVLPGKDGLAVLADIKKVSGFESTPVLALTMHDNPETTAQLYRNGGNSLIQKPVGFRALVDLMRTISTYWVDAACLPSR